MNIGIWKINRVDFFGNFACISRQLLCMVMRAYGTRRDA